MEKINPGEVNIFCIRWVPPSHLYNGYRVIPGGKAAGAWRSPSTPSSAEDKAIPVLPLCDLMSPYGGELYLYLGNGTAARITSSGRIVLPVVSA